MGFVQEVFDGKPISVRIGGVSNVCRRQELEYSEENDEPEGDEPEKGKWVRGGIRGGVAVEGGGGSAGVRGLGPPVNCGGPR